MSPPCLRRFSQADWWSVCRIVVSAFYIDSKVFLLIKSIISTSSSFAVFISISNGGCDELVHHFETVVGAHPNSLDSQRLDFFFSARTTFRRLRSLLLAIVVIRIFATKLHNLCEKKETYPIKMQKGVILVNFIHFMCKKSIGLQENYSITYKKKVKLRWNWNKISIFAVEKNSASKDSN